MTDDIVTRLRNHVRGDYEKTAEYLLGLAADEIERLRTDVNCWSNWAIDYACDDTKCECDRCTAVRAAWEGAQHGR